MPTNTSLTINSTQNGKKVTDKISYVNPNITTQQALDLAQAINNLTNNAYVSTTRQDTIDLDGSGGKPALTFTAYCAGKKTDGSGGAAYRNFDCSEEHPSVTFQVSEISTNSNSIAFSLEPSMGCYWGFPTLNVTGSDLVPSWNNKTIYVDYPKRTSTRISFDKVEPCVITFDIELEETPSHQGAFLPLTINIVADQEP